MTHRLDEILLSLGINAPAARKLFKDNAVILERQKNTDIFVEGKKNNSEYLLISGIMHRYNLSEKGESVTTGFYLSGAVITPHFARTNKEKSIFSLQNLTDAVIAEIPVAKLDNLRATNKEFHDFGQRVVEKELSAAMQLQVTFRSCTAKERLLALRKQYPNLENHIPHHIIASYLGITPVSFSRLRNELSRE